MKRIVLSVCALLALFEATETAPRGPTLPITYDPWYVPTGYSNTRVKRQDSDDQSYNAPPDPNDPSTDPQIDPASAPAADIQAPGPANDFDVSRRKKRGTGVSPTPSLAEVSDSDSNSRNKRHEGDVNNSGTSNCATVDFTDPSDGSGDSNRRQKRQIAFVIGGGPGFGYGRPWGRSYGYGRPWRRGPWGYNPYRPYYGYYGRR